MYPFYVAGRNYDEESMDTSMVSLTLHLPDTYLSTLYGAVIKVVRCGLRLRHYSRFK